MSKCISINGEYSEHEPSNQEFVCGRCFAFDEEAAVAEVDSLRQKLAERDALIESQERLIAALTGSLQDVNIGWIRTLGQLAERDAVIERVAEFNDRVGWSGELRRILDAAPVSVLAEHDARLLEELAAEAATSFGWLDPDNAGRASRWIASRAAEYRKGAGQ